MQYTRLARMEEAFERPAIGVRTIYFDGIQVKASKDPSRFVDIIDLAIQKKKKIWVTYEAEEDDFVEEARMLTPLSWRITKDGHVLLVAYQYEGETHTYRLDRFTEVKSTGTPGQSGEYDTYYDYYSDIIEPDYYNPYDPAQKNKDYTTQPTDQYDFTETIPLDDDSDSTSDDNSDVAPEIDYDNIDDDALIG